VILRNGTKVRDAFLHIVDQVATDGERGPLSIAFAPDYEASGRFRPRLAHTRAD
jgi:hypothetical protein